MATQKTMFADPKPPETLTPAHFAEAAKSPEFGAAALDLARIHNWDPEFTALWIRIKKKEPK